MDYYPTLIRASMGTGGGLAGRNLILLLGLGAIWGTAFMFISLGFRGFQEAPFLFAALRFDIAGVFVLAVAAVRGANLIPRGRAQWTAITIAAVLNVAAYHAFLFWGQRYTTAAVAAVIVGLNPVLTTFASRLLLKDERMGLGGLLGLASGLTGVIILASLKPGSSLFDLKGLGELAVVVAVASWALGSTIVRRTRHGMDVFAFTAWHMLVGALVLHVVAFPVENLGDVVWNRDAVISLLYLAIASSGVGFLMYFTLLERVGPIRSNLVSHVAPVFAAVAGWVVLGQPFELRALAAFVLIAAGFMLVARPTAPLATPPVRTGTQRTKP